MLCGQSWRTQRCFYNTGRPTLMAVAGCVRPLTAKLYAPADACEPARPVVRLTCCCV